ncbi:TPA: hypothetical protein ACQSRL_001042 [Pseudomonas aeruginosa]|uniref:hypothetical protein n=1 Tax=Pseudomonas aeruginosa TaxID=287 RepID=UPI0031B6EB41
MTESKICTCPSGDGSLRWPCPKHPAVEQAGGDERAAFNRWIAEQQLCQGSDISLFKLERNGALVSLHELLRDAYQAGQDRAALAQPSPAQAEAERPGVVARVDGTDEDWFIQPEDETEMHNEGLLFSGCELGRMIDFDRIVGELRADRDSWAEQAEQRLADWDEMRKERDAALVEVERLRESKGDPVGSLEKCMKVMYERDEHAKRLEVAQARVAELEGKLTDWVHEGFRLNEALAVAKAQHSVPDDDTILQIFADNAEHSEQGDEHGYCIVREQHAQAIARKLLAAAPGNSAQHSVPEGWKLVPIEPLLNMMSDKDHDTRITAERQLLSILADAPVNLVPQAWLDVQAERRRQVEAEGWTPEHDDEHSHGQMARAAACYALAGSSAPNDGTAALLVSLAWPWDEQWWKPSTARRDMVKAGALILAEIERLDRAAPGKEVGHE